MYSRRAVVIVIVALSAFVPLLAAEEPRFGKVRLVRKFPESESEQGVLCFTTSFSADAGRLLLVKKDSFWLYDVKSGKELARFNNKEGSPGNAVLSPNGRLVAARFGIDRDVLVYDMASKKLLTRLPHKGRVTNVAFSADGGSIITSEWEKPNVYWWDTKTWKIRRVVKLQLREPQGSPQLAAMAVSADEKMVAVSGEPRDVSIRLYDMKTGAAGREFVIKNPREAPTMAFSPDHRYLAAAINKDYIPEPGAPEFRWFLIYLWDVESGKIVREFRQPLPPLPNWKNPWAKSDFLDRILSKNESWWSGGLAFSRDGKTLVNAYQWMQLWEVATGRLRYEFVPSSDKPSFYNPCFSRDGRFLAAVERPWRKRGELPPSKSGCAYVWDWRHPVLEEPKNLEARDIERLWNELASEDAVVGYRAIAALLIHPELASAALAVRLQPVETVGAGDLERLIANLDDDNFSVREKAVERLAALSEVARPALLRVKTQRPSLEVRRRVEDLLARFDRPAGGLEHLRCLRAVEVLESIGSPEARRTLSKLASGAIEAVETIDARNALQRMDRK